MGDLEVGPRRMIGRGGGGGDAPRLKGAAVRRKRCSKADCVLAFPSACSLFFAPFLHQPVHLFIAGTAPYRSKRQLLSHVLSHFHASC